MKKSTLLFLTLSLGLSLLAQVENPDKPKYGNWDFGMKLLWSIDSIQDVPFSSIAQMKIHKKGQIYVYDSMNSKFYVFDSKNGAYISSFGSSGQGPGEYNTAMNFFFYEDILLVYDVGKILYFSTSTGNDFLKTSKLNSAYGLPPSYFLDEARYLSIPKDSSDPSSSKRVVIYDITQEKSSLFLGQPQAKKKQKPKPAGGGRMVFVREAGDRNEQFKVFMILGRKNDLIFYGINDSYVIKAVDLNGKEHLSFSLSGRKRQRISNAFKNEGGYASANLPDFSTYFYRIFVDDNNLIYTFVSDIENPRTRIIDIFSPEGEYLYQAELEVPPGYVIRAGGFMFHKNSLFVALEDPDGELSLNKYQIALPNNHSSRLTHLK